MRRAAVVDQLTAHRGLGSLPGAWVELAHGRLSAEEALRRARAEEDGELAERTARMLAPPTAAQSEACLQAVLEQWSTSSEAHEASTTPSSGRWILGVVALAAAAVLLVVMPRVQPGVGAFDAGYELELERAVAAERNALGAGEVPQYRLDRPIQLTVRPAHRVIESVGVQAFATNASGRTIALPIEAHITPQGVVEILGRPRAWGLDAGRWQLVVVVGPPSGLPTAPQDVRLDPGAPYDVARAEIEVLEDVL